MLFFDILDIAPCESFSFAKNGSWNLKQLVLIAFSLLEYICNIYVMYGKKTHNLFEITNIYFLFRSFINVKQNFNLQTKVQKNSAT